MIPLTHDRSHSCFGTSTSLKVAVLDYTKAISYSLCFFHKMEEVNDFFLIFEFLLIKQNACFFYTFTAPVLLRLIFLILYIVFCVPCIYGQMSNVKEWKCQTDTSTGQYLQYTRYETC